MPWRRIGLAVAVIVASLIVLGRISSVVVDWAWFSTIGYVGVFWTMFATKAMLFLGVFVAASLLLWVNGALAFRFTAHIAPFGGVRCRLRDSPGIARAATRIVWLRIPVVDVASA